MSFIKKILSLVLIVQPMLLASQNKYPTDYFGSPIDFPISLSGTFGELRNGHLHSGIDIRTQGVEGKPIKAIADGWVSRVVVSPTGYGKAIYIDHPNGYTSLYGHCQSFYQAIEKYVNTEQYRNESFAVDLKFTKNEFPVKKGQLIAKSGNSGSSGGPHIHFEIRDTKEKTTINPLFFGYKIKDYTRPQIKRLLIYPYGPNSSVNGKNIFHEVALAGWGLNLHPKPGQDTINVCGKVYFGIEAFDRHNDSQMDNGVFSIKLMIDSVLMYSHKMEKFDFEESRQMLALVDYPYLIKNKKRIQRSIILPNNELPIYKNVKHRGIYRFDKSKIYQVKYVVGDIEGNESVLTFHIKGNNDGVSFIPKIPFITKNETIMRWDSHNVFKREGILIEIPKKALFDTLHFKFSINKPQNGGFSPVYHIHDPYTPLLKSYKLAIKPTGFDPALRNKLLIVKLDTKNEKPIPAGGKWDGRFLTTNVREFGSYTVLADTKPPTIKPANIQNGKNISGQGSIRITVTDDLAGIETFRATMNGKWILMDWDPKRNLLEYKIDEHTKKGKNTFRLSVVDTRGNEAVYEATLYR